ncbi:fungal specific transcription factor [Colletotrichum incanum]|nr:fungal specific transcription factor [Colletotrichum incanum]
MTVLMSEQDAFTNQPQAGVTHAAQVCVACKTRKKKCDKLLPRCGRGLNCQSGTPGGRRKPGHGDPAPYQTGPALHGLLSVQAGISESETNLYLQIRHIIQNTGLFVDKASACYFEGFHRYLPFISRARFHEDLITVGTTPSAGYSALLLSICLINTCPRLARHSEVGTNSRVPHRQLLYVTIKSLFVQIQAAYPPSISFLQACVLLAVYEYAEDKADEAFASVASCIRLAYRMRLHLHHRPFLQSPKDLNALTSRGLNPKPYSCNFTKETVNTWWAIVICERLFFCEVTVFEQPLLSDFPEGQTQLPADSQTMEMDNDQALPPSKASITVSELRCSKIGPFGRATQAVWILDQVLSSFKISDFDLRFTAMNDMHTMIQELLALMLRQCDSQVSFIFHSNILDLSLNELESKCQSLKRWQECSRATLNAATKMVLDIADAHDVQAALRYLQRNKEWSEDDNLRLSIQRLRRALGQLDG